MPYLFRRPLLAGVLLFAAFLIARRLVLGPPRPLPSDICFLSDGRPGVLRGRILGPAQRRGPMTSYLVEASGWRESPWGGFAPARGRVAVTVPGARPSADWGDEALFWGRLKPLRGPAVPGAYDERKILGGRRVFCRLSARGGGGQVLRPAARTSPLWWVVQARRRFSAAFGRMGPEARAIVEGLVLGERPSGFAAMKEDFRRSGTVHLLVASGTNVAFVLSLWWMLGRWVLSLPRRVVLVLGVPLSFFYAFLAGADPPVLRAAVMSSAGLAGLLAGRVDRPVHLVGVAALVLLILDPDGLFHASFQMSFAATLGLALGMPAVEAALRWKKAPPEDVPDPLPLRRTWRDALLAGGARLLAASLLSQWALAPFLIFYFGTFSLAGPVANMIAVPWGAVCLFLGAGLFAMDLLSLPGASAWSVATEKAALGLWKIAALAGRPSWAEVSVPWTAAQVLVLGVGAAATLLLLSSVRPVEDEDGLPVPLWTRRRAGTLAAAGAAAALAIAVLARRPAAPLLLWPGGGSDAAAVLGGDGAALVDPGPAVQAGRLFPPFLRASGARVRWLVFTRPPRDGAALMEIFPGAEALCAFEGETGFPCRSIGAGLEAAGGSWRRVARGALSFSREGETFLFAGDIRAPGLSGHWTAASVRPKGPLRGLARSLGKLRADRWILRGRGGRPWESTLAAPVHRPARDGWLIRRKGLWETETPNIVKSQE